MSYDTARDTLETHLQGIAAIATVTDGVIPFVDEATPLAMIASTGQRSQRTAQVITVWWLFEVRLCVPINGSTVQDAKDAETALRTLIQVVPATFRSMPRIKTLDIDASPQRTGYQEVNGQAFRVATMPVEVQEHGTYGGTL